MFILKRRYLKKANLVCLLAFLCIILQVPIWPFWSFYNTLCFVLIFILFFYTRRFIKHTFLKSSKFRFSSCLLLLVFVIYPVFSGDIQGSNLAYWLCFLVAYALPVEYRRTILHYVTLYLAAVVVISLPPWILMFYFGVEFPVFGYIDLGSMKGSEVLMANHILFVQEMSHIHVPRFYSMFDEPGVLGTIGAFVLLANKYDFKKWYNVAILLGCLFTFSFAFYVLSFIGYSINAFIEKRKIVKSLLVFALVFVTAGFFLKDDPIFQQVILSRVDDGVQNSLDNRTSEKTDRFLLKSIDNLQIIMGIGANSRAKNLSADGSSYKIYLLERGLVGCFVLFYAFYCLIVRRTKFTLLLLLIYLISFSQRPQLYSAYQILLFSVSVSAEFYVIRRDNLLTGHIKNKE